MENNTARATATTIKIIFHLGFADISGNARLHKSGFSNGGLAVESS